MDEKTLEALKGSIEKWQKIVDGTGKDCGSRNCPLCRRFNGDEPGTRLSCQGCPVNDASNDAGCDDTPFDEWANALGESDLEETDIGYRHSERSLVAAKAELEFLKSLLPSP